MGQGPQKITKQWAEGPFKLIETPRAKLNPELRKKPGESYPAAFNAGNEMALVHNTILRGLNSIYIQAPNVEEDRDVKDFLTYMYSWSLLVHIHHDTEESLLFPMLEKDIGIPGWMEKNVEQHKAFGPGIKAYDEYVANARTGKEKFDGVKIRNLIDSFGTILMQHLTEEIQTFIDLEQYADKIDWPHWNKRLVEHAVGNAETDHEIPVILHNLNIYEENGIHSDIWPPFPWHAALIFRWVYVPRNKGAWRFGSSDAKGRPRELAFV